MTCNSRFCLKIAKVLFLLSSLLSIIGFCAYYTINNPTCLSGGANLYGLSDNNTVIKHVRCYDSCDRELCNIADVYKVAKISVEPLPPFYAYKTFNPIDILLIHSVAVIGTILILDVLKITRMKKI